MSLEVATQKLLQQQQQQPNIRVQFLLILLVARIWCNSEWQNQMPT